MSNHTHAKSAVTAGAAVLCVAGSIEAQEITRGPYLQSGSASSMVIVWDQNLPSLAEVRFGPSLHTVAVSPQEGTHHEVHLQGLTPNTSYDYAVFHEGRSLSETRSFTTAPEGRTPFRFVVYGDTRSDHSSHQNVMERIGEEQNIRFLLHTGDLVSDGMVGEQWDLFFQIEQPVIGGAPLYPVLGNHDVEEKSAPLYFVNFVLPEESPAPEAYYSFDYGNVHVIALDSHIHADSWAVCLASDKLYDNCFDEAQLSWLESDLEAARHNALIDHILVAIHIGPYSSKEGRAGNGQMRELMGMFENMGVSLIVSGHDHYYERGFSSNGVPYVITGGGGAPLYQLDTPRGEPHVVEYNNSILHYLVVDVDGPVLTGTTKDWEGNVIDTFSVDAKPPDPAPDPPTPPEGPKVDDGCDCRGGLSQPSSSPLLLGALAALAPFLRRRWRIRR